MADQNFRVKNGLDVGIGGTVITALSGGNVGLGSTNPTQKLWVDGNGYFTGILTANRIFSSQYGEIVGTALSISGISTLGTVQISSGIVTSNNGGIVTYYGDGSNLTKTVSISTNTANQAQYLTYVTGTGTTSGFGVTTTGLVFNPFSGYLGIGDTNPTSKLSVNGNVNISGVTTSGGVDLSNGQMGPNSYKIVGTTVLSSTTLGTNVVNSSLTSVGTLGKLTVTGISTFSSGPVLIKAETPTGTSSQPLQVTGGAFISGNVGIGTTNPTQKLWVDGNGYFTGILTANRIFSSQYGEFVGGSISGTEIVGTALSISGISTLGTVQISSGIVTSNNGGIVTYYGDGSNLTKTVSISTNTANQAQYLTYVTGTGSTNGFGVTTTGLVFNPSTTRLGIGTDTLSTTLNIGGVIRFTNNNIRIGDNTTGCSITSGTNNFFAGNSAGRLNTTGCYNNFFGCSAGCANTTGCYNNFFGNNAGRFNTTGSHNNFIGHCAGYANTTGGCNNFFGSSAGCSNTTGCHNNFFGRLVGRFNTTGGCNNFLGLYAGYCNTSGSYNNFFGRSVGYANTTGSNNNFFGARAGCTQTAGDRNVALGHNVQLPITTGSDQLNIGSDTNSWISGNSSFNVGIGTTNPTSKLWVNGDGYFVGVVTSAGFYVDGNLIGSGSISAGPLVGTALSVSGVSTFTNGPINIGGVIKYTNNNIRIGDDNTGCSITSATNNFFAGASAGRFNTSGSCNNFFGSYAGYGNTTGCNNNFFGYRAGKYNTTGNYNNFFGKYSGRFNTTGSCNNILGPNAGECNTSGSDNNFFGTAAGFLNTSGSFNNFIGKVSGYYNITGNYNNFFGSYAGYGNTTGCNNNFFGCGAGKCNTTGSNNNFLGNGAGSYSTTGSHNNFLGYFAGCYTTGCHNNFFGNSAGKYNTTGCSNNFFGNKSGLCNTDGINNNFLGYYAGKRNTQGINNNFLGYYAGGYNTQGNNNNFFGFFAGRYNTTGGHNNFFGYQAGKYNSTGNYNNFFGTFAGYSNTTGCCNNFFGRYSGRNNTTGSFNSFYGTYSANTQISGNRNVAIGYKVQLPNTTGSDQLNIGSDTNSWITGNSNFNVGVGVSDPTYRFTVATSGATATPSLNNVIADFTANVNSYSQINTRNESNGANASTDIIATADTGTDTTNYIDLGINNSGHSVAGWTINGPLDGYLYTSDTNLSIGAASANKYVSIFAGGTLAANEEVRINSTGVGIGTTNPSQTLHVQGNARVTGAIYDSTNSTGSSGQFLQSTVSGTVWVSGGGGGLGITDDTSTNATRYIIFDDITSGTASSANVSSTKLTFNPSTGNLSATQFTSLSDVNRKTNIRPIENAIELTKQLNGVRFDWKGDNSPSIGVIAQEVEQVLPELVVDTDGVKSVSYGNIVGVLIEAIKEQQVRIEELERKLNV